MQILLGEINLPPSDSKSWGHDVDILERAAEVYCAWKQYDQCVNGNDIKPAISRDWHKRNLLSKCAGFIVACAIMIADANGKVPLELDFEIPFERDTIGSIVLTLLTRSGEIIWAGYKDDLERAGVANALLEDACIIVANLGVTDFRPYMQECEQLRNIAESNEQAYMQFDSSVPLADLRSDKNTDANVDHPGHYNKASIECIDAIKAALTPEEFRGFCKGNALKYIWREQHKGGDEDLRKAEWYLQKMNN